MPGVLDEGEYGRSQSQSETDTYNGSGDNMYYSWDVEGIHFISMNSETAVDTANFNTDEIAWATADLGTVDRVKTPWLIASFHRPMYCTYDGACTTKGGDHLRSQAEDLFFENKVDLVIAGHVHAYERTYPMYNNTKVSTHKSYPYIRLSSLTYTLTIPRT
jgi:acid phosphatase type 7